MRAPGESGSSRWACWVVASVSCWVIASDCAFAKGVIARSRASEVTRVRCWPGVLNLRVVSNIITSSKSSGCVLVRQRQRRITRHYALWGDSVYALLCTYRTLFIGGKMPALLMQRQLALARSYILLVALVLLIAGDRWLPGWLCGLDSGARALTGRFPHPHT
jgi:hypothetical protein